MYDLGTKSFRALNPLVKLATHERETTTAVPCLPGQICMSRNGRWQAQYIRGVDDVSNLITVSLNPLMTQAYSQYASTAMDEAGLALGKFCESINYAHDLCACSKATEGLIRSCIRDMNIDPDALQRTSPAAYNILANQCPCINPTCSNLFNAYKGTSPFIDLLGPAGVGSGTCPLSAITTVCTNSSVLNDSTIRTGTNEISQQCGYGSLVNPEPVQETGGEGTATTDTGSTDWTWNGSDDVKEGGTSPEDSAAHVEEKTSTPDAAAESEEKEGNNSKLLLWITLGVGIPLLLIIIVISIIALRSS